MSPEKIIEELLGSPSFSLTEQQKEEAKRSLSKQIPIKTRVANLKKLAGQQLEDFYRQEFTLSLQNLYTSAQTETIDVTRLKIEAAAQKQKELPATTHKRKRRCSSPPVSSSPPSSPPQKDLFSMISNIVFGSDSETEAEERTSDQGLRRLKRRYRSPSPETRERVPKPETTKPAETAKPVKRTHLWFQSQAPRLQLNLPFYEGPIELTPIKVKNSSKAAYYSNQLTNCGKIKTKDGQILEVDCNVKFVIKGSESWSIN